MGRIVHSAVIAVAAALLEIPAALAQDAAAAPGAPPTNAPFQFILQSVNFFLVAFFIYYILVLRPSQLKQETQARFLRDLKKDDEVLIGGSIFGKVATIQPEFIGVEISSGTRIRVRPDQVSPADPKKAASADARAKPATEKERKAK